MAKPKLYTKTQLQERKRSRNRLGMRAARRKARGLPEDAPPYAGITGEFAPAAKLTSKDVKKARQMHEAGHTVTSLADRFGVSKSTMSAALSGRTWKQ